MTTAWVVSYSKKHCRICSLVCGCLFWSYLFKALHISMVTRTDRAIVMG